MEDQEAMVHNLDVGHVPVNVQVGVLLLVLGHVQQDVADVPVLVLEYVVEVVAVVALTTVLDLAEDAVEDVLDAIKND